MTADNSADVSPRDMVTSGLCTGCGACVAQAGRGVAKLRWGDDGQLKPFGAESWYGARTEAFSRTCPFSPVARNEDQIAAHRFPLAANRDRSIGRFEAAFVGHASETGFRERGSSGGMVSWVAAELLRRGLIDGVAHVGVRDPAKGDFFSYRISRSVDDLNQGAKSRYYPVEMSEVLREMRDVPGRYAVVGIPCFIKAVHLLRDTDPVLRERIVITLGLVCGHMKSRDMVESFAWQMGADIGDVERVEYRLKNPDRPASWYTAQLACRGGDSRTQDWTRLVDGDWGSGFFQNSACDFCDDVVAETADISFGDAWVEPYSSDGRGTNVVIVRSSVLHALVSDAMAEQRLDLTPIDAAFVVATQAAGFRQRREGLAYRLSWHKSGVRPRKRVLPGGRNTAFRRKLIYRCRHHISRGSTYAFRLARWLGHPQLFLSWGKAMVLVYHALTYSRGRLGRMIDGIEHRFASVSTRTNG
ncbi:MAG: coenzyme hydrogenase [Sphingomonadales bacterium]|nr:coenzyme hydrogenase [Sphingomonadales bacterium]